LNRIDEVTRKAGLVVGGHVLGKLVSGQVNRKFGHFATERLACPIGFVPDAALR
jgi:hypothetical protein